MTDEKKFADDANQLPKGFEEAAPKLMWWVREPLATLQGVLLEVEERKGGKKNTEKGVTQYIAHVRVTVTHDSKAVMGSDKTEDKEEFPLSIGDVVSLDVSARLMALVDLAQEDIVYEIYIRALKKIDIGGGHSMWNYHFGKKATKEKKAGAFPGK